MIPALLYGMQRTGSNYIEQLLAQNFDDIQFFNDNYSRCLPTHKHFRLYDEKYVIPSAQYYNTFIYQDYSDFKNQIARITKKEIRTFIVVIKNPLSWYISYKKHAIKNGFDYFKKTVNSHFILDYNLFYTKWMSFMNEAPDEVLFVKYEDALSDLPALLNRAGDQFNLNRASETIVNPDRVSMNKRFTDSRKAYYREEKFIDLIDKQAKHVIMNLLDEEIISLYNM